MCWFTGYFEADLDLMWQIITRRIAPLAAAVETFLSSTWLSPRQSARHRIRVQRCARADGEDQLLFDVSEGEAGDQRDGE